MMRWQWVTLNVTNVRWNPCMSLFVDKRNQTLCSSDNDQQNRSIGGGGFSILCCWVPRTISGQSWVWFYVKAEWNYNSFCSLQHEFVAAELNCIAHLLDVYVDHSHILMFQEEEALELQNLMLWLHHTMLSSCKINDLIGNLTSW